MMMSLGLTLIMQNTIMTHLFFYSNTCGKTTPQSVERLREMLQDPNMSTGPDQHHGRVIIGLLDIFQSRRPIVTKVFDYLEDLHMKLKAIKNLSYETCEE